MTPSTARFFSALPNPRRRWPTASPSSTPFTGGVINRRRVLFFAAAVCLGPAITASGGGGGGGGGGARSSSLFAMAATTTTGPTVTNGGAETDVTVPRVEHHDVDLTPSDYDDDDGDGDDDFNNNTDDDYGDYDDDYGDYGDYDVYDDDEDDDFADVRVSTTTTTPSSDSFSWEVRNYLDADVLVEGCTRPAVMTGVSVKKNAPSTGNVAALAIDGDPSTKWAVKGKQNKRTWMDVEFDGAEGDGDNLVEGLAIAFFRGDKRVAFFDLTLYNKAGDEVAKLENMESGGGTDDFEEFYFNEAKKGSRIRIGLYGTTAGLWNAITEVSTCLVSTKTPAPVTATLPPTTVTVMTGLTYVGCFMDDDTGATRLVEGLHTSDPVNLTPLSCAAFCAGYKYLGLQFSQECFCGDTYFSAEQGPIATEACFMPCSGDEHVVCGGPWANSVYLVGEPAELTEQEKEAENAPHVDDGVPRRKLTMVNKCNDQIRVGATGGFVTHIFDENESCPEGSVLDDVVGACFWALPLPEDGKSYDLEAGGSLEVILDNAAMNGVRWSGNIWASTGCQNKVGCETASCLRNRGYPDGYCPPSTGPTGPVTKAEFTLIDTGVDYYDITTIDGVNLPVEMKADPLSMPLVREDEDYWCSNPGGVKTMSTGLADCSWHFDATNIDGLAGQDLSSYLRWVRDDGLFSDCENDADCAGIVGEGVGENLKCGLLFGMDALNGGVTEEAFPKKCGSSLGWHSPNAICGSAHGKPLGYFPNSYPFMCNVKTGQVKGDNSTQAHLFGCAGPYYGLSGYSKDADETACGCPDWVAEGIMAPSSSECHSKNPYWDLLSLPWLKYLKAACPTAYCFPYDDHSSTFVCRNEDENNTHDGANSMSYIITFCPADSLASMMEL